MDADALPPHRRNNGRYLTQILPLETEDRFVSGSHHSVGIGILGCLLRLNAIGRILRDFREARGPLWELKTTVSDLKELEPAIQLLGDKVEAARKQVVELQADRISTRSDTNEAEGIDQADESDAPISADGGANRNWLQLREYWQRNRKRIEYIIDQIEDGRTLRTTVFRAPTTSEF